ncbi:MAG: DUF4040 domain-containing protein [Motilibacteraceae bacterium]
MTALVVVALTLVLLAGAAVVLTGDPLRQAVTLSVCGLVLAVLFLVVRAPDVALGQVAVQTVVVPLMVLLAVRTIRDRGKRGGTSEGEQGPDGDEQPEQGR